MALPESQRGYVWDREQARSLFESLFRRHPVGGLLVWVMQSKSAAYRSDEKLPAGVVKLLLDGQQRMTTLYGGPWQAAGILRWECPSLLQPNVPRRRPNVRVLPAHKDEGRPIVDQCHRPHAKGRGRAW